MASTATLTGTGEVELARATYTDYDGTDRRYGFKALVDAVQLASRPGCNTTADTEDACGWFELGGAVLLPFWNALTDVVIRATNLPDGAGVNAGKSLVVAKGFRGASATWTTGTLAQVTAEVKATAAAGVDVSYDWAFDVEVPVRWEHPRFIADPQREKNVDLGVFAIHGAADYVTPEDTRISFGASADLAKLRPPALALNVDLRDPESVAHVDDFLDTLIGSRPLAGIVSGLRQPSRFIQQAVGSGFEGFIEDGIRAVVEDEDLPIHPATEALASALAVVQTLPQQLAKAVFDPVKSGIDEGISALGATADGVARDVWNTLPQAWVDLVGAMSATTPDVATINAKLATVETYANTIDTKLLSVVTAVDKGLDKALDGVGFAETAIDGLASKVTGYAQTAQAAVTTILALLDPSTPPPATGPDPARYFRCDGNNPILKQVDQLGDKVAALATALDFGKFAGFVNPVTSVVGVDAKPYLAAIDKAVNPMRAVTKALVGEDHHSGYLGDVKKVICAGTTAVGNRLPALVAKVRALLLPVKTTLDDFLAPGANGKSKLENIVTAVKAVLKDVRGEGEKAPIFTLTGMKNAVGKVRTELTSLQKKLALLVSIAKAQVANAGEALEALPPDLAASGVNDIHAALNLVGLAALEALGMPESQRESWAQAGGGWVDDGTTPTRTFVAASVDLVRQPLDKLIGAVTTDIGGKLSGLVAQLPFPTGAELREHIVTFLLQSPVIEQLTKLMHEATSLLFGQVDALGNQVLDQLNALIKEVVTKFNALAEKLLGSVTAAVGELASMGAAKLDGFAEIRGDDLMRLQIDGEYSLNNDAKSKSEGSNTSFKARLKIEFWATSDKAKNCGGGGSVSTAPLDASLTVRDLPIVIGPGNLKISKLELGFTLAPEGGGIVPVGVFGGIETTGSLNFQAFELYDIAIAAGVGLYESYLGARAAARFQGYDLSAAFLVGKTCDGRVLKELDPEFWKYVNTDNGFAGIYVRGSCSFPIYDVGCLFKVGAGVDVGVWILDGTYGGLLGGRIYGKALCIIGVAGGIRLVGQIADGDPQFLGEGWAAGGIGFCDSDEWQSVDDAVNDGGCLVGWAAIGAEYKNGSFSLTRMDLGGLD
ncbi:MAG: hypothetical protein KC635_03875 [Myxococcales bacterium]|nr:hypothetical protein [Myxococcales bacterium]MCB9736855.1 hypothetical protein [Deltaproteobacteria bacterium]